MHWFSKKNPQTRLKKCPRVKTMDSSTASVTFVDSDLIEVVHILMIAIPFRSNFAI